MRIAQKSHSLKQAREECPIDDMTSRTIHAIAQSAKADLSGASRGHLQKGRSVTKIRYSKCGYKCADPDVTLGPLLEV